MESSSVDEPIPVVNSPKELLDLIRRVNYLILVKKGKGERSDKVSSRNIFNKDIYLLLYMFAKLIALCSDNDKIYHSFTTYLYYHFPEMKEVVKEYKASVPLSRVLDFITECKKFAKIDYSHNPPSIIIPRNLSREYRDIVRLLKSDIELKNKLIKLLSD